MPNEELDIVCLCVSCPYRNVTCDGPNVTLFIHIALSCLIDSLTLSTVYCSVIVFARHSLLTIRSVHFDKTGP